MELLMEIPIYRMWNTVRDLTEFFRIFDFFKSDFEFVPDEFSSEGEHLPEDVFEPPLPKVKDKEPELVTEPPPSVVPSIGRCRVIYDYDSNMFDELTIRTGMKLKLTILEKS